MDDADRLARDFEAHRTHLRAVAYRMLGSTGEAEDAVQEAWLRLGRSGGQGIDDPRGWLTTVLVRVCVDGLRTRASRREESLEALAGQGTGRLPDPLVVTGDPAGPEERAVVADGVGLAMLVVLDALTPAERVAFVLHDLFAVPFEGIAPILDRSPAAARQLASRARRRVRGAPAPDPDLRRQRAVADSFLAAARGGGFDALVAVLVPDVVLRVDLVVAGRRRHLVIRGADDVARRALGFADRTALVRPVWVDGAAGLLAGPPEAPQALLVFTATGDHVAELLVYTDPPGLHTPRVTSGSPERGGRRGGRNSEAG